MIRPFFTSTGVFAGYLGSCVDITDRKEASEALQQTKDQLARVNADLEKTVRERTAKLQDLVGELEHFSYTITHDMRAPLRAMRGFAELLGADLRADRRVVGAHGQRQRQYLTGRPQHGGAGQRLDARGQRGRPVADVALHLLRVAGVGRGPNEEIAGAQHLRVGEPPPGVVVGLALGVTQVEVESADGERQRVAVARLVVRLDLDAPGLAYEQHPGREVPGRELVLPEGVEPPRGDAGEVDARGPGAADAGSLTSTASRSAGSRNGSRG